MLLNVLAAVAVLAPASPTADAGSLIAVDKTGKPVLECPLEHTSVHADVSGFGARVTVVQTFANLSANPIEAVYTFPLPTDAAVDRMRIETGKRIIEGLIKRRQEARRIYDAARAQGQVAALLDQERPNIFTQSVANILPGEKVKVEISYSELLPYEHGQFEFNFPMVVGPRFLGNAPDPGKIAPPITPKGTRTGSGIDLTVNLQAGAPIQSMESVLHKISTQPVGKSGAVIKLAKADEIPNRDFILRYRVATDQVQSAFLTHQDPQKGGFFALVLLPPVQPVSKQIAPRELIFVMDQSGSQNGFPIEKSKELTLKQIHAMRHGDTFNVLSFSNDVRPLWPSARPNTPENVAEAEKFVQPMQANGGTQLRLAVDKALGFPDDPQRLRLVVFNTDGFVGDEKQILDAIQKHRRNSRMFTFGIGNSVNHFLIDAMSQEGRGDSCTVTLNANADAVVDQFLARTQSPVLTDVEAHVEGTACTDLVPAHLPDVFSGRPVVVYGRYSGAGPGKVVVTGRLGGQPWSQTLNVNFGSGSEAPALMSLWARKRVDDLTTSNWLAQVGGEEGNTKVSQIVDTALEFNLMTEYTSFVAVEPRVVNVRGKTRTVRVPVEMADGVSYEGVGMGTGSKITRGIRIVHADPTVNAPMFKIDQGSRGGGLGGGGFGGGFGGGGGGISVDGRPTKPAQSREQLYQAKVSSDLRKAKGTVEVEIFLTNVKPITLATLKELGLKVDVVDEKLKLVMGTCNAVQLIKLAQMESVERIEKLE